jgi:uncharacterized protein
LAETLSDTRFKGTGTDLMKDDTIKIPNAYLLICPATSAGVSCEEKKMANPVVHFEIAGLDEEKTKAFYTSAFEWEVGAVPGMEGYNMVNAGRTNGMGIDGGIMKAPHGHAFCAFYIQVDSLREKLDQIVSLGGEEAVPPTPIPGMGAFAFFKDPDGNLIGLFRNGDGD